MPKCDVCESCLQGRMSKGAGMKGPSAPEQELEVGFDIIGPLVESPDGNTYKLVGCETSSGIGACVGLPDRKSQSMLRGVQIILARIRLGHKYNDNVTVRFHSDIEKSL